MKLTLMLANVMNRFLGSPEPDANSPAIGLPTDTDNKVPQWVENILAPIFDILEWLLPVIMICLGIAGVVFAIVLGVNYAKAENAEAKDKAKGRLINAVVGILVTIVALVLIFIFIKNVYSIFGWTITDSSVSW